MLRVPLGAGAVSSMNPPPDVDTPVSVADEEEVAVSFPVVFVDAPAVMFPDVVAFAVVVMFAPAAVVFAVVALASPHTAGSNSGT
jgi:hypothetical protein